MDIRFLFIGQANVGKKSIIARFKLLKATKTIPMDKGEMLAKYKKKSVKKREWESLSEKEELQNKQYAKEFETNNELFNFKKIFKIPAFITLDNKFYNIESAIDIGYDDIHREHQEEVERIHKIKFDDCKADINYLIDNTKDKKNTYLVFSFVFDLSHYESFEKIMVYFNELNRVFSFKEKYKCVLIGNKLDLNTSVTYKIPKNDEESKKLRKPFDDSEKLILKNFIAEHNLLYYEISTKLKFNFEILYESLFSELIRPGIKSLEGQYFQDSFNTILSAKENFPKSPRTVTKINNYPGPEKYDNPYDIPQNNMGIKKIFNNKYKFKTKIFLNKVGPSFGPKLDLNKLKLKNAQNAKSLEILKEQEKAESKQKVEPMPPEYYKKLYNLNYGYSFSTKDNHLGLREKRRSMSSKVIQSFDAVFFNLNNISVKTKSPSKFGADKEKKLEELEEKKNIKIQKAKGNRERHSIEVKERRLEIEERKKEKVQKLITHNNMRLDEKNNASEDEINNEEGDKIKDIEEDMLDLERKRAEEDIAQKKQKMKENIQEIRRNRKSESVTPGPGRYDLAGDFFSRNKAKTFGIKYADLTEKNLMNSPKYRALPSDIDEILKKVNQPNFGNSQRFAVIKERYEHRPDVEESINRKKENIKKRFPEMSEIMSKLAEQVSDSIARRQERLERANEGSYKKYDEIPGPGSYSIAVPLGLDFTKDSNGDRKPAFPPACDLKDSFNKGPAFTMGIRTKIKDRIEINDEQLDKVHGLEQSLSFLSKNVSRSLNNLPNFNYVKNKEPSYSLSKSERFPHVKEIDPEIQRLMDAVHLQDVLRNSEGVEVNNDSNRLYYQGKSERFKDFHKSPQPGPAKYYIEGFSEKLVKDITKRQQVKLKRNHTSSKIGSVESGGKEIVTDFD